MKEKTKMKTALIGYWAITIASLSFGAVLIYDASAQQQITAPATVAPVTVPSTVGTSTTTTSGQPLPPKISSVITSRGALKVYLENIPSEESESVRQKWSNRFPPATSVPDVYSLKDGREMWQWDDPAPGEYLLRLRLQYLNASGWDVVSDAEHSVTVGPDDQKTKPVDPVPPAPSDWPITETGLKVLLISSAQGIGELSRTQEEIVDSNSMRDFLMETCGQGNWRIVDPQEQFTKPSVFQKMLSMPRKSESLPWVVISATPRGGVSQSIPKDMTADDFKSLVKRFK